MAPLQQRSTMEEMLESIKSQDERSKDVLPALPQRPSSKARLPSTVRRKLSAPPGGQNSDMPTQSPAATGISVCEPGGSLFTDTLQQAKVPGPFNSKKDQNNSSHIQGAWINTGSKGATDGVQAYGADGQIPCGGANELSAVSGTDGNCKRMGGKGSGRSNAGAALGIHFLPLQGQVGDKATALSRAKRLEKSDKEATELILRERRDLELEGIGGELKEPAGVTDFKGQNVAEVPCTSVVDHNVEENLMESNGCDLGFSTAYENKNNVQWEDDGISGLKKNSHVWCMNSDNQWTLGVIQSISETQSVVIVSDC